MYWPLDTAFEGLNMREETEWYGNRSWVWRDWLMNWLKTRRSIVRVESPKVIDVEEFKWILFWVWWEDSLSETSSSIRLEKEVSVRLIQVPSGVSSGIERRLSLAWRIVREEVDIKRVHWSQDIKGVSVPGYDHNRKIQWMDQSWSVFVTKVKQQIERYEEWQLYLASYEYKCHAV